MRLIVGLGNPGERYAWTPHNLGFLVVDALSQILNIEVRRPEAYSKIGRGWVGDTEVVLAKPQTLMNGSGQAVRQLLQQWKASPHDLIIVVDDLDLPWGQIRIRERGRAGTHNGMRSVQEHLETTVFPRLRMGIQPDHPIQDWADFVLRPFARRQRPEVDAFVERGAQATLTWVRDGLKSAMNQFNAPVATLLTAERNVSAKSKDEL